MADPQVKIIISAVDKASAVIKGMAGTTKNLNNTFQQLTGISLGTAGGIALVGAALQKGAKFARESITDWVKYNQQIREIGQVTGISAEAISRIIQVGDDWLISSDAIRTSLAFMNKQGITPSIDNLAELADEYVNTTDKSAFAEKAVKILGRGYQTLIPLLALGGKGLREATAAIDDNLIATEKSIDATREYEVMMDTFNDTAKGVGNTLATILVPALTDMGNSFINMIDDNKRVNKVMDTYKELIKAGIFTQESFNDALKLTGVTADGTERGFAALEEAVMAYLKKISDLDAIHAMDKGERDLTDSANNLAFAFNSTLSSAISDAREDMGGMTDNEIYAQKLGLEGLKQAADNYASALGTLTDTALANISDGMGELMRKQALLTYFQADKSTPALKEQALETYKLSTANGWQLSNVEKLIKANEDNIVSDANLLAIMSDSIVTNEELASALGTTAGTADTLAKNTGMAHQALHDMDGTTVTTTINEVHNQYYNKFMQEFGQEHNMSSGANFVVPPGYPNDSYHMNVESGEHVVVVPKGGTTTNNSSFTMNVHTNAPYSTLMSDYYRMKAMAG